MTKQFQKFFKLEAAGGILLFFVLIIALCIANSSLTSFYHSIIDVKIQVRIGDIFDVNKSFLLWINEGLMAVFFMLLALEIKREVLEGELSKLSQIALPVCGAIGGIIFPALVYLFFNRSSPETLAGWPIPITTDIAFVLGVLALLGKRVPSSIKIFLVALSIVDDIIAVTIIAIFYTDKLSILSLSIAGIALFFMVLLNVAKVTRIAPYLLLGILIWVCVLKSGVHATLAGVVVGLAIPLHDIKRPDFSPLRNLEHILHPWVAFMILPLFVFANGGVDFRGMSASDLVSPVPLGIAMGLFIGKSVGVFLSTFLFIKLKLAQYPYQSNGLHLFGISALTGIGFTMSLFLSALAFYGTPFEQLSQQGVLIGSLLSGILGVSCFMIAGKPSSN